MRLFLSCAWRNEDLLQIFLSMSSIMSFLGIWYLATLFLWCVLSRMNRDAHGSLLNAGVTVKMWTDRNVSDVLINAEASCVTLWAWCFEYYLLPFAPNSRESCKDPRARPHLDMSMVWDMHHARMQIRGNPLAGRSLRWGFSANPSFLLLHNATQKMIRLIMIESVDVLLSQYIQCVFVQF